MDNTYPGLTSWATLSRPCGTQFPNEVFTQALKPSLPAAVCGTAEGRATRTKLASVQLIEALGVGWDTIQLPGPGEVGAKTAAHLP